MIVYHGSTQTIETPDAEHSKRYLDFGKAFYVTSYRVQAERWAKRKYLRQFDVSNARPILNEYALQEDFDGLKVLRFGEVDEQWFDFVCDCRNGIDRGAEYDVIVGKVANDDVFKTIQKYLQGRMSKQEAIAELRYAKTNDQIAFKTNQAIAICLKFIRATQLSVERQW